MTKLYEFDEDEWRDVCRYLRPELSDEEFTRLWNEFQTAKAARQLN